MVLSYYNRIRSKSERNYCATFREFLAVVDASKHFRKYLYGQKFILRTNHAALKWLLQFKCLEGQVARWIERLQLYTPKRKNSPKCGLWLLSCLEKRETGDIFRLLTVKQNNGWDPHKSKEAQQDDLDILPIIDRKNQGELGRSELLKSYCDQWNPSTGKRTIKPEMGTWRRNLFHGSRLHKYWGSTMTESQATRWSQQDTS